MAILRIMLILLAYVTVALNQAVAEL